MQASKLGSSPDITSMLRRLEISGSSRPVARQATPLARVISSLARDGAQQRAAGDLGDSRVEDLPEVHKEQGNALFRSEMRPTFSIPW